MFPSVFDFLYCRREADAAGAGLRAGPHGVLPVPEGCPGQGGLQHTQRRHAGRTQQGEQVGPVGYSQSYPSCRFESSYISIFFISTVDLHVDPTSNSCFINLFE